MTDQPEQTTRKRKWSYTRANLAELLGVTKLTVSRYIARQLFDPASLRSVLRFAFLMRGSAAFSEEKGGSNALLEVVDEWVRTARTDPSKYKLVVERISDRSSTFAVREERALSDSSSRVV